MNTKNPYIQMLITLRLKKLHQEGFSRVKYEDLEEIFFKYIYKRQKPKSISEMSDRVLNISVDEIIRYLSLNASVITKKEALSDILRGDFNV